MDLILKEAVQLRSKYNTLKKAKVHANEVLPIEPKSLVEQYLEGKERPSKEQVVASRKSRYSKRALPASTESESAKKPCACKGKCFTKKCYCRGRDAMCDTECNCKVEKCKNRSRRVKQNLKAFGKPTLNCFLRIQKKLTVSIFWRI